MKSQAEYLKDTNHCPKCGSENVEVDRIQADENYAWANVTCQGCDAEWTDLYTLTGYEMSS